jgi:hypothetical protein
LILALQFSGRSTRIGTILCHADRPMQAPGCLPARASRKGLLPWPKTRTGRHRPFLKTVDANQTVQVQLVYAPSYNQGTCIFSNFTTGKWTSFLIPDVGNAIFTGNVIEWIVEAPMYQATPSSQPTLATLPTFGSVTFSDCGGCSSDKRTEGDPDNGFGVNIVGSNGTPLTSVSAGPGTITVTQLE